jgi:hypothetical protein
MVALIFHDRITQIIESDRENILNRIINHHFLENYFPVKLRL